jgi:hypothetical protein
MESVRVKLETLEIGECLVWIEGTPGTSIVCAPFDVPETAIREYVEFPRPTPDGTVLMMAEYAGYVRRFIWRTDGNGYCEDGAIHWAHTTPLRASWKLRPSPQAQGGPI